MNWPQHSLGGIAAGSILTAVFSAQQNSIIYATHNPYVAIPVALSILPVALFGASLPDLDKTGSHAANRHRVIAFFLHGFKHRGATHSLIVLLGIILLGIILKSAVGQRSVLAGIGIQAYFFAIAVGFFSHQILDLITTDGIMLFWPFSHESIHFGYLSPKKDGWWIMLLSAIIIAFFCSISLLNILNTAW